MSTKKWLAPILTIAGSLLFPPLAGALGLGGGGLLGLSGATVGSALGGAVGGGINGGVKGAALGGLTSGLGSSLGGALNNALGIGARGAGALSGNAGTNALIGNAGADVVSGAGSLLGGAVPAVSEIVVPGAVRGATSTAGSLLGGATGGAINSLLAGGGAAATGATGGPTPVEQIDVVAPANQDAPPFDLVGSVGDETIGIGQGEGVGSGEPNLGSVDPAVTPDKPGLTDKIADGLLETPGNIAGSTAASLIVSGLANALGLGGGGGGGAYNPTVGGGSDGVPGDPRAPGTPTPNLTANGGGGVSMGGGIVPSGFGGGGLGGSPFSTGGGAGGSSPAAPGAIDIQGSSKPNIYPWVQAEPERRAY